MIFSLIPIGRLTWKFAIMSTLTLGIPFSFSLFFLPLFFLNYTIMDGIGWMMDTEVLGFARVSWIFDFTRIFLIVFVKDCLTKF